MAGEGEEPRAHGLGRVGEGRDLAAQDIGSGAAVEAQQAAPFAGGLVAQALGVGHAGQQHEGQQQQDGGGAVVAPQGAEAVGGAQQAGLQQGRQGGEQAAVLQGLDGLEAGRLGAAAAEAGGHAADDIEGAAAERGGGVQQDARGLAGRRLRRGCPGRGRVPGRAGRRQQPFLAVAVNGPVTDAESRGDLPQAETGGQQVGRLLQLGGVGQGGRAAPGALPVEGRFASALASLDGAVDRALAQVESGGECGDRGGPEADQLGDDAVARAIVVALVAVQRQQVVVVDGPLALVPDRQARVDRDSFRREDFQGCLAWGQRGRRPVVAVGRGGSGRTQAHTHGIQESEWESQVGGNAARHSGWPCAMQPSMARTYRGPCIRSLATAEGQSDPEARAGRIA